MFEKKYTRQELTQKIADENGTEHADDPYYRQYLLDVMWSELVAAPSLPHDNREVSASDYALEIRKASKDSCMIRELDDEEHFRTAGDNSMALRVTLPGGEMVLRTELRPDAESDWHTYFEPGDGLMSLDLHNVCPKAFAQIVTKTYANHEEWYLEGWKEIALESKKLQKMRELNHTTLLSLLRNKLQGTGIEVEGINKNDRALVTFDVGHASRVEIYVSYSNFPKQTNSIVQAVLEVKAAMDKLGRGIYVSRNGEMDEWQRDGKE